ncbi:MAG TPA: preprotein translocase subunit SecY [Anaerolineales bacterium]|jgi:preprotein translocase subunit SecY|uniref:Protein translocase subunit SecY n=1 Tax=uncultured Chloroflexi bacterium Rifle_16ft_4_minimus_1477 TaxID=1665058 RepID=A0A0H4TKT0_9CHLR|nr:preprotein translocase subunit, preprotein translocase subunit SecY [uncultured Chloroflexi bacterium Rifle_16ft_4_minimus_1477]HLD94441.1 preprotein translocase subunit SecY [Anaerolineales bacterium]
MRRGFAGVNRYVRLLFTAPDIRRKLLITFVILVIYRFVAHIPVPGVDRDVIAALVNQGSAASTLVGLIDLISGGTLLNFSVLAMGVYPYITAQIILQLLMPLIPSLQKRMEEDPREGRKWMERWTYYLAVPMAALTAIGQINIFSTFAGGQVVEGFGFFGPDANVLGSAAIIFSMTAGTMFAIWLGELISEYGIRNQGLSLIIFAGIISRIPANFAQLLTGQVSGIISMIAIAIIMVLTVFVIVYVQQGRRNVPVMYPGRRMGNRMSMPVKGTLPLMVNMSGMIPLIFAQAILQLPSILSAFFANSETAWVASLAAGVQNFFNPQAGWYWLLYFLMVFAFSFFYTDVLFAQQNYGENLKRVGAQIPGVSRGAPTQKYLTTVLRRITLPGAVFLGAIAVLPFIITRLLPFLASSGAQSGLFLVSSSGLLIVVGTVRETFFNIDAELKLHGYEESLLVR